VRHASAECPLSGSWFDRGSVQERSPSTLAGAARFSKPEFLCRPLVGTAASFATRFPCAAGSSFVFVLTAIILTAGPTLLVLHARLGILTTARCAIFPGAARSHFLCIPAFRMAHARGMSVFRTSHLVTTGAVRFLRCALLRSGRARLRCGLGPGNYCQGQDQC
jgi:hypothetical protein